MASSNKLASARSIFEQNIQKNREAGCDKNILGHKAVKTAHCSRLVSRRLFASQTLSESSSHSKNHHSNCNSNSNSNSSNDSCSSTLTNLGNSSHHRHQNKSFRRLSNSSSSASHNTANNNKEVKDSSNNNSGGEHQPRGQVTVERRSSSLELNKRSSSHDKIKTTTTTSASATDKQPTIATNSERIHDANLTNAVSSSSSSSSSFCNNNKRIGSISSLADHLGKLELRSLGRSQHRLFVDDNSSSGSHASLESHRDRLKLPDFRQSSIAPRRTASNNSHKSGSSSSSSHTIIMPPGGFPRKVGVDTTIPSTTALDDSNQSYDVNQLCSKHARLDNSSSTNTTHPAGSSSTLDMSHSSLMNNSNAAMDASAIDASSSSCLDDSSSPRIRLKRSTPQRIGRSSSSHNDQLPIPTTTTTTTTTTRSKSDTMGSSNSSSGSRRSSNHARRESGPTSTTSSSNAARNNNVRATLSQHFAARGGGPKPSAVSSTATWIRPSADVITEDDGSCSNSSEHSKPLKTVPFPTKKTIIKRHSSHQRHLKGHGSSNSSTLSCYSHSNSNSNSSLDSSSDTIGNSNSSAKKVRTVPLRRRSSTSQMTKRPPLARKPLPPPKPDPEELSLMEELEALQKQIETSQGKLGLVQQGEQYDLKRVQETQERKLKRIDAAEKTQASTASSSSASMTKKEEEELKELYKQAKQTIRQLKQENARIHTQNRKARLEILTTTSTYTLLEENKAETLTSLKELEVFQKQALQEHDHLVQLASTYQKAIMDLEDAMDRKNPLLERVKKMRILFEDRIDIIVDFMQKKCSDFELVEELTMMAFDEEGWETDDDDDESECDNESDHGRSQYQQPKRIASSSSTTTTTKSSFVSKTPYINRVPNNDDRPLSVEMIPTSSHSLHIFL